MSKPVCTSLDQPPADVDGTLVHVRDQNWQQGLGDGEKLNEPRFVKSWSLDGGQTWGIPGPPATSNPDQPVPGQSWPGMTTYDFRGYVAPGESRVVTFQVAAGTRSRMVRGDGSVAYDVVEWGWQYVTTDDSGPPVRFTVVVKNAGTEPPPEPPPSQQGLDAIVTALDSARNHWLASHVRAQVKRNNPNAYPQTHVGLMESAIDVALYHAHELRRQR